jgi:hypothetical protein
MLIAGRGGSFTVFSNEEIKPLTATYARHGEGGIRIGLMRHVIKGGAALQQPPLSSVQQAGGTPVKEPGHDVGGGRPLAAGGVHRYLRCWAELVFTMGYPRVSLQLPIPIPRYTHTQGSGVRVVTGKGEGILQVNYPWVKGHGLAVDSQ